MVLIILKIELFFACWESVKVDEYPNIFLNKYVMERSVSDVESRNGSGFPPYRLIIPVDIVYVCVYGMRMSKTNDCILYVYWNMGSIEKGLLTYLYYRPH